MNEEMLTRLQRRPLKIPAGVTVSICNKQHIVEFKKGQQTLQHAYKGDYIEARVIDNERLEFTPSSTLNKSLKKKVVGAHLGTAIAIASNHLNGLKTPFVTELVLKGTGYKVAMKKQGTDTTLIFNLGKSHDDVFTVPAEVEVVCPSATEITLKSANKQLLGQTVARIRKLRVVDSYKGKGVLFKGQVVSLKETKKK